MKKYIFAAMIIFQLSACSKDEVIPEPTATFNPVQNKEGNVSFNISTANADSFVWDFGDGGTSFERMPTYTYDKNGTYTVTLSAKGKGGQTVTTGKVVVNNITGSVMFWMQSMKNKEIEVSVDGKFAGRITGYYANGIPNCGSESTATLIGLTEGTHTFEAKELNAFSPSKWSGSVNVIGRRCSSQKLTYTN